MPMQFIDLQAQYRQLKGRIEYHSSGPVFDDMKKWNPAKHPGHGAAALVVEQAYRGADKLL